MKPLRLSKSPGGKSKSNTIVTHGEHDPASLQDPTMAYDAHRPDPTCPICQIDIGTKSPEGIREGYAVTPCGHVFGHACIKRYLAITEKPPCPVCRADLFHACSHPVLPAAYDPIPRSSKGPRLSRDEAAKKAFPVEPRSSDCAFCRGRRTKIARRIRKRELLDAAARRGSNANISGDVHGVGASSNVEVGVSESVVGGGPFLSSSASSSAASAAGFSASGSGSGGSASSEGGDEDSDLDEGSEENDDSPSRRTRAMRLALTIFHLTGAVARLTLDAARSRKLKALNSEDTTGSTANNSNGININDPLSFVDDNDNGHFDEDEDDLDAEGDTYLYDTPGQAARRNQPPVPGQYGHWDLAKKGPDWKFLGWYDQQEPKMKTTAEHFT